MGIMEALWTPLFSFTVFVVIFALGDVVANKTKAMVSSVIVGCVVYLVGFLTGIIPSTSVDSTFLPNIMSTFGIALLITNLGTMMNLEELIREWKTVLVALAGLVGVAVVAFTVGSWVFGRDWALLGSAPISGGLIAALIASDAANAFGRGDIAAYVILLCAFQMFVGVPIASYMLRKEAKRIVKTGDYEDSSKGKNAGGKKFNIQIIKSWPKSMQSQTMTIAKLAIVAVVSVWLSNLTKFGGDTQMINQNVMFLIMGVIATEIGFLNRVSLQSANAFGFLMIGLFSMLPGNFKTIDLDSLLNMIWPIVGMLLFSAVGIAILSSIMGKVLKMSAPLASAIGVCCLFGYPCTQIITEEVVASLDASDEEKSKVSAVLLPKMIVSGFTTVTIASVVFAGIVVPLAF